MKAALAVCAAVAPPGRASYTCACLGPTPAAKAAVAPAAVSAAALVLDHATVVYGHVGPPAGPFALAGWLYARTAPAAFAARFSS